LSGLDVICAQFVASAWAVAAVVVGLVAVYLWRTRHRASRAWVLRWLGSVLAIIVALVIASAVSVNAYFAYLPTLGDATQAVTGDRQWGSVAELGRMSATRLATADRRGLVIRLAITGGHGDGFGATTNIVYLPRQYFTEPAATFPVVYLFHGSPGRPADWFHAGRAAQEGQAVAAAGEPAIIVAPQMSRSWTDDPECVDGVAEKVETHLFSVVIPTVEKTFRTQETRAGRIFAGMSAGGFCALNLGLRHRDAVATIIDMSGDTDPTHTGGAASLFGKNNPHAAAEVAANNPAEYAASLSPEPPMRIWLDSGRDDTDIVRQMTQLDRTLTPRVGDLIWRTRPGGHTYWVWTAAMREALPWALGGASPRSDAHSRPGP
jgi:enterochelin esterase-like enzyme